ncbi:MAG: hypothetical protein Q9218_007683 [Villophora microphyllina]
MDGIGAKQLGGEVTLSSHGAYASTEAIPFSNQATPSSEQLEPELLSKKAKLSGKEIKLSGKDVKLSGNQVTPSSDEVEPSNNKDSANGALSDLARTRLRATWTEWNTLHTFTDSLHLNRLFLQGKREANFNHVRPLEEESTELIPGLLALHDLGILTVSSQPFIEQPGTIKESETGVGQWHQRPYIDFLIPQKDRIPRSLVVKFHDLLFEHPKIVTVVRNYQHPEHCCRPLRSNFADGHVVTRYRHSETIEELDAAAWEDETIIGQFRYPPLVPMKVLAPPECIEITVAARSWEEDVDLVALIKVAMREAGIPALYRDSAA